MDLPAPWWPLPREPPPTASLGTTDPTAISGALTHSPRPTLPHPGPRPPPHTQPFPRGAVVSDKLRTPNRQCINHPVKEGWTEGQ